MVEFAKFQWFGEEHGAPRFTYHVTCLDKWVLQPEELDLATQLERSKITEAFVDPIVEEMYPWATGLDALPSLADVCLFYYQFAPDPLEEPLDGGGVPILVVGNPNDPVTPFFKSEELATEVLSNGYLLEVAHYKHIVYPENQCVNDHVHRVLIDGVYPGERRVFCEREDPEPEPPSSAVGDGRKEPLRPSRVRLLICGSSRGLPGP